MDKKREIGSEIDLNTLHNELAERRCAMSEIRGTVYKIVAAVSAAGIVLFWLLLIECELSLSQTIALSIFVIAMAGFVYFFLNSFHNGFQKNREIMKELEKRLGLHDGNLLPEEYQFTQKKITDFIPMAKLFILFMVISILAISWRQYIVSFCGVRKDNVIQQKQSISSPQIEFLVKAKEAKDFSIKIKYNNGGAD